MERTFVKRSVFIAIIAMLLCALSAYSVHAATLTEVGDSGWRSSNSAADYLKVTGSGTGTLNVEFKHSETFDGLDVRLFPYSTKADEKIIDGGGGGGISGTAGTYSKSFSYADVNGKIANSDNNNQYYLFIYRKHTGDPTGDYKPIVRGPVIQVSGGKFTIYKIGDITTSNTNITNSYKEQADLEKFKKTDMSDVKLLLFHNINDNNKRDINSATESNFYKTVSDAKKNGAMDQYTIAKNLFKYVATTFYYDETHTGKNGNKPSFDDPYNNLLCAYNGTGNNFNAFGGNVALRCDGYAGVYCALVRAQGIPCRIVSGKHMEPVPKEGYNWNTNAGGSHTWCEVYVNNKWIVVDPCLGGEYNEWKSDSDKKMSTHVNWEYFDMTPENYSLTHKADRIHGDYKTVTIAKVAEAPTITKKDNTHLTINWKKVSKAVGYQIYFRGIGSDKNGKGQSWKVIKTVDANKSTTKTQNTTVSRQLGFYKVRAYAFRNDVFGLDSGVQFYGEKSNGKKYYPSLSKPKTPTVTRYNSTKVKVTWKKVTGATNYQIQYKGTKKSSKWKVIATVGNVTSAKVSRQLGYYRVRAYTFVGNSKYGDNRINSSYSTSKQYKSPLSKPKTPAVKKAGKSKVKISWKAVTDAQYYEVYSSKYKNKGFKKIKVVKSKIKSVTVLGTRNKTKYYKVRAYAFIGNKNNGNNRVNSPYSSVKAFKLK